MERKELELIDLKPGEEFYLLRIRYKVLVKYDNLRITARRAKDGKILELRGNLKVIPIPG